MSSQFTAPLLASAALVASLATPVQAQCPPGAKTLTATFTDSFGPFSGTFDSSLSLPLWDPAGFPAGAELVQVELVVSATLSSAAFVSNKGNSSCSGTWSATVGVAFQGNGALGVPPDAFEVQRGDAYALQPGGSATFPLEVVAKGLPPFLEADPADLVGWTGAGSAAFAIQGATDGGCVSSCGQLVCDIDLFAEVEATVVYTYCVGENQPPVCEAGGLLNVPCQGELTQVQLDATGSFDPDDDDLSFLWTTNCEDAFFDDPTSPAPLLFVPRNEDCNHGCVAFVRVSDGQAITTCHVRVFVYDAQAPVIDCAPELKAACGSTDPEVLGFPEVADLCDPEPELTHVDEVLKQSMCEANRQLGVVRRTWTAVDDCGNTSVCVQLISVDRLLYPLDAVPGACPNVVPVEECAEAFCPQDGPAKPSRLTMVYTGDSCDATSHSQDAGSAGCTGDALLQQPVRILATNKINGANVRTWFDGVVSVGDAFVVDAANGGSDWLQANVHLRVYDLDGNLLQHAFFHTSCSQPLAVGDRFGSCFVAGFELSDGQGGGQPGAEGAPTDIVAFTLVGGPELDVTAVLQATVRLRDPLCQVAPLVPLSIQVVDETGPSGAPVCECGAPQGPDGFPDLRVELDRAAVVAAFGLADLPAGAAVQVALTGELADG